MQEEVDRMDKVLSSGKQFLVGDRYTLADVVATCLLARIYLVKQRTMFTPKVNEYFDRMKVRESYKKAKIMHVMNDKGLEAQLYRVKVNTFLTVFAIACVIYAYFNQDMIKGCIE